MKPDWDKLIDEFKDSKTALVADVDCTTDGKDLCEKHGVKGYPTIKWGDPDDLKDYDGGRSFADLKKFAEENLGPTCGPDNLDLCDDANKAFIEKLQKMDDAQLKAEIDTAEAQIAKIEAKSAKVVEGLEKKIAALQKEVEAENKKKDALLAKESKKLGLSEQRKVSTFKKKADKAETKKKSKKKAKKEL